MKGIKALFVMVIFICASMSAMKRTVVDFEPSLQQQPSSKKSRSMRTILLGRSQRFLDTPGLRCFVLVFTEKKRERLGQKDVATMQVSDPIIVMPMPVRVLPVLSDLLVRCGHTNISI